MSCYISHSIVVAFCVTEMHNKPVVLTFTQMSNIESYQFIFECLIFLNNRTNIRIFVRALIYTFEHKLVSGNFSIHFWRHLEFSEIQTELTNIPISPNVLTNLPILPSFAQIANQLNVLKFKCSNFISFWSTLS